MNMTFRIQHIDRQQAAFWFVCTLIVAAFTLYMYFIASTVVHVVLRQEQLVQLAELNSVVSELETDYLARQQEITPGIADAHGLVAINEAVFTTRADNKGRGVTLNR